MSKEVNLRKLLRERQAIISQIWNLKTYQGQQLVQDVKETFILLIEEILEIPIILEKFLVHNLVH